MSVVIAGLSLALSATSFVTNTFAGAHQMEESNKARQQNLFNTATSWRQQALSLEAQADTFAQQAEDSYQQAEIFRSNAGAKLEYGQQQMSAGTQAFTSQRKQMNAGSGATQVSVGRSSVEMKGSAERLVTENAAQMSRDLTSLRSTTERELSSTLAQRKIDLMSATNMDLRAGNFLQSEINYDNMAATYISDAEALETKAEDIDTDVGFFEYIFG